MIRKEQHYNRKQLARIKLWKGRFLSISYDQADKNYGFVIRPKRRNMDYFFAACMFIPLWKTKNGHTAIAFNYFN